MSGFSFYSIDPTRFRTESVDINDMVLDGGPVLFHSSHDVSGRQVTASRDNYVAWVDGWLFSSPDYQSQVDYLLLEWSRHGRETPSRIEGQFNAIIHDKNRETFYIFNDIWGLRRMYQYQGEDGYAVSFSPLTVRPIDGVVLNKQHLKNNISNPRFLSQNETFVIDVSNYPAQTLTEIQKSGMVSQIRYNLNLDHFNHTLPTPGDSSTFADMLVSSCNRVHTDSTVSLQLSGGLDSRLINQVLNTSGKRVQAFNFGVSANSESVIAQRVSDVLDNSHAFVELKQNDFIDSSNQFVWEMQGLDIFPQCFIDKIYRDIEPSLSGTVVDTGLALDVFIGGSYQGLTKDSIAPFGKYQENYKCTLDDINRFVNNCRVFPVLFARTSYQRKYIDDRYLFFTYPIQSFLNSTKQSTFSNHSFYSDLLKEFDGTVFELPLHSTSVPATVDPTLWPAAISANKEKERATRLHYQNFGKATYHNHYYSDFDMWLRAETSWTSLLTNTIGRSDSFVKNLMDPRVIDKLVESHLSGQESHFSKLIKLMSLEMFVSCHLEDGGLV